MNRETRLPRSPNSSNISFVRYPTWIRVESVFGRGTNDARSARSVSNFIPREGKRERDREQKGRKRKEEGKNGTARRVAQRFAASTLSPRPMPRAGDPPLLLFPKKLGNAWNNNSLAGRREAGRGKGRKKCDGGVETKAIFPIFATV